MEVFRNNYTGEKYDDYEDCRESVIEYQCDVIGELREVIEEYLAAAGGDRRLKDAVDYYEDCLHMTDQMVDMSYDEAEELISSHISIFEE